MTSLNETLDELAALSPTTLPFISLYLNAQPDQHGRDSFERFMRKEFAARSRSYTLRSPERESFDRDTERIRKYLRDELQVSANGVAIFACAGDGNFFEAVQFEAPIEENRLYVYHQPHLYPLARLMDQHPRFAALVADTNSAQLFVFGGGARIDKKSVIGTKVSKTAVGGWSQMRFQRHVENYHLHHAKEVIDTLTRLVREEDIENVVLAGDEIVIPLLLEQMPGHLAGKVADVLRLDIATPEHEVLQATAEALRQHDARNDKAKVKRLFDEFEARGQAVLGVHDTLAALANGQVDEVLLGASLEEIHDGREEVGAALVPGAPNYEGSDNAETRLVKIADELVTRARQSGARITFIEDTALLAPAGGVGALLRYAV